MSKKKYDKDWYEREIKKDQIEVESYKNTIIESLKTINREEIFKQPEKQSIWSRIIKSLGL